METTSDEVLKAVTEVSMLRRYEEEESRAQAAATAERTASSDEKDKKTASPRLFPATLPPDASPVSFTEVTPTVAHDGNLPAPNVDDEEHPGTPPTNPSALVDATVTQEQAYPAYLAPDPEEARRRALEQAVLATNVHVIEKKKHKSDKWVGALLVAALASVAAIALSIGFTLGRRDDYVPSIMPTPAPTSERFGQVVTLVESLSDEALQDPSSPQYQAAQWMAEEDELFGDLGDVDPDQFRQRYVMALFYFATGGPTSWLETSFFLKPDIHECEWRGEGLPNTQSWSGYVGVFNCSSDEWVERIEINQNNLTGTLPMELGSLSSLSDLTVFGNSIGGTLPTSIFSLSNLQGLIFDLNEFTGTIPTEVGRATSLQFLWLRDNSLTGTIPTEIGNLSSLNELDLGANTLTGLIPETLLGLSNITFLEFARNALTGTLPPSLWSSWPNLTNFGVMNNQLSGTIPNNLDSVPHLEQLNLQSNNFTGPFPSSIVKLTNVTDFDIAVNAFTGSLPNDWTNLSSTLDQIEVSTNRLTGTLPESLGSLTKLEILTLWGNGFNGTIPPSLGNLTKLQGLEMGMDRLTGTVPTSFVQLTSLQRLTLQRSGLTGDLSFLCNGTEMLFQQMTHFHADCYGENAKVICPCCNYCCNISNTCYHRRGNDWVNADDVR